MKKIFIFFLFIFIFSYLSAQDWTEPINISNMDGSDYLPDFVIDNNSFLHCVWSHIIETWYRVVYYSKSEDDGETWSEPQIISQNTEHSCFHPKIASDFQDNLYLIYELNTGDWTETAVYFQKFDGDSWSYPMNLTEGYPGANAPQKIIIDSEDRVYAFFYWFSFRYRYLENGEWSEVLYPYPNPPDADIGFMYMVVDSNNNLHLTGKCIDYNGPNQTIYAHYNKTDDVWSELDFIQNEYVSGGEGIALDNEENPHIVIWASISPYPPHDATQYSYFDGENWSYPEIIVEDPYCQMIEIIGENIYLLDLEKDGDYGNVVIYSQDNTGNWFGEIIYTMEYGGPEILIYSQNILYLLLTGKIDNDNLDIYLMKKNIEPNSVEEPFINLVSAKQISLSQNYPNPLNPVTCINFSLNKEGYTTLKIFNLKGQLVMKLIEEYKKAGDYSILWDSKNKDGKEVSSGIYLYRLQVENHCITRSLTLVK